MAEIKLLNSFKSAPLDDGGKASVSSFTFGNFFVTQADLLSNIISIIAFENSFASQADIVFATSSDIDAPSLGPAITSIDGGFSNVLFTYPSRVPVPGFGGSVIIYGTGFTPTSVARWDGLDRTTNYVSPTELVMDFNPFDKLSPSGGPPPGWPSGDFFPITVNNPPESNTVMIEFVRQASDIRIFRFTDYGNVPIFITNIEFNDNIHGAGWISIHTNSNWFPNLGSWISPGWLSETSGGIEIINLTVETTPTYWSQIFRPSQYRITYSGGSGSANFEVKWIDDDISLRGTEQPYSSGQTVTMNFAP